MISGERFFQRFSRMEIFMTSEKLRTFLLPAISFRNDFLTGTHDSAFRLFNGFTEGMPELAIDVFAKTAVIHDYSKGELGPQSRHTRWSWWLSGLAIS